MTTHDGGARLAESLDSVLTQSWRDFECVVVDDASTDATPSLLAGYAARDARIRVLSPSRNLGVVGARNLGFAACRGEYVAMLDHDDLSRPARLARQVAYLDARPGVVLVATGVLLEEGGRLRPDAPAPSDPLRLRWALQVGNPLTWSSVMVRAAAVRETGAFVRPEFEYADDFDLYHRLLARGEVGRLEASLTVYRLHGSNTTWREGDALFARGAAVLERAYRPLFGEEAGTAAALVLRHLSWRKPARDLAALERLGTVLERVLEGFCAGRPAGERAAVEEEAAMAWWDALRAAARTGLPGALRLRGTRPALRRWTPPRGDRLATRVVAGLRSHRWGRGLEARLRGTALSEPT